MSENELLSIAKELLNQCEGSALTGSLMLFARGINKRREAHDIDILVKSFDNIPVDNMCQNSPMYPNSVQFKINEIDVCVDFLLNESEEIEIVNGIPCGQLDKMLHRKYAYSRLDNSPDSQNKHRLDLEFLEYNLTEKDLEFEKSQELEFPW